MGSPVGRQKLTPDPPTPDAMTLPFPAGLLSSKMAEISRPIGIAKGPAGLSRDGRGEGVMTAGNVQGTVSKTRSQRTARFATELYF